MNGDKEIGQENEQDRSKEHMTDIEKRIKIYSFMSFTFKNRH